MVAFLVLSIGISASYSAAATNPELELREVGVTPELGKQLDLSLKFRGEDGTEGALSSFVVPGRPFVVVPAYYHCPRLCGLVMDGVLELINKLELGLGKDFSIVTVSFDPTDTPELAKSTAKRMRDRLSKEGADPSAWRFLVGDPTNIHALMTSLGFKYKEDEGEYSHAASIFFVSPDGKLSQYLAGIQYSPEVARYTLVEAGKGVIGSLFDQAFLFCFRYDHLQGRYMWAAFGIMRAGGILTLSFLSILLYRLWYQERRKGS